MSRFWTILVIMVLVLLPGTALATGPKPINPSTDNIVQQLMALEPFVHHSIEQGITVQIFDSEAALKNGFTDPVVRLAQQMVDYQNALARAAASGQPLDGTDVSLSLDSYPEVKIFFETMSKKVVPDDPPASLDTEGAEVAATEGPDAVTANACGDWDHPVPNYTPPRGGASTSNPERVLLDLGFHHTVWPGCNYAPWSNCGARDFTKGRSYSGPYGTCGSPRFRNQGRILSSTSYEIQYGEPNPEIFSYSWPYWNWGAYVKWWHGRY